MGVRLSKDVMECAGAAMKTNISVLAPLILPISEQVGRERAVASGAGTPGCTAALAPPSPIAI